jgi:hypothetical protein
MPPAVHGSTVELTMPGMLATVRLEKVWIQAHKRLSGGLTPAPGDGMLYAGALQAMQSKGA